ncbi:hypothetical protein PR202_ga31177 [Eleusine coracana subsp. coracana]|uniref:Uncharacterized protein n=1 Tax=Eleusine coracana subsp. coracana TaxID=191504 RepID=A0AAV5DRT2_ELECO|nr:hypothetical protein PR202_ga31177 [Eleusine coracana subsp. coracana]
MALTHSFGLSDGCMVVLLLTWLPWYLPKYLPEWLSAELWQKHWIVRDGSKISKGPFQLKPYMNTSNFGPLFLNSTSI